MAVRSRKLTRSVSSRRGTALLIPDASLCALCALSPCSSCCANSSASSIVPATLHQVFVLRFRELSRKMRKGVSLWPSINQYRLLRPSMPQGWTDMGWFRSSFLRACLYASLMVVLMASEPLSAQCVNALRSTSYKMLVSGCIGAETEKLLTRSVGSIVSKFLLPCNGFTPFQARGHCFLYCETASSSARPWCPRLQGYASQ